MFSINSMFFFLRAFATKELNTFYFIAMANKLTESFAWFVQQKYQCTNLPLDYQLLIIEIWAYLPYKFSKMQHSLEKKFWTVLIR